MIKINDQIVMDGIFPNNEIWIKNNLIKNNSAVNFVELFYESDSDLIKLYMVKNELDRYGTKSILSIKYMPYSRMDREVCDYVYSLEYIAKFINDLKFEYVEIYDAHSPKTLDLVNNSVWRSFVPNLLNMINITDLKTTAILIPDNGAKRYLQYLNFPNILYADKKRDLETGKIIKYEIIGDYKSMWKVIIIDDLTSYGGTFLLASSELKSGSSNVRSIDLVVAHSENSMFKGELLTSKLIDRIYTTNSIPKDKKLLEENKDLIGKKLMIYEV